MQKLTPEQLAQIEEYLETLPENERKAKEQEIMSQLQQGPQQCPFCLMAENKIQTAKIYEDEFFMAVLEINPANKGHIIITTKKHIKSFSEFSDQEMAEFGKILKKLTTAVSKISPNISIIESEGQLAGNRFEHFIFNIIPRSANDNITIAWNPKKADDLEKIKQEIIKNIPKELPKPKPIDHEDIKKRFKTSKQRLP
jgi:histidine triad (HIT) family protein